MFFFGDSDPHSGYDQACLPMFEASPIIRDSVKEISTPPPQHRVRKINLNNSPDTPERQAIIEKIKEQIQTKSKGK